jgi:hypothetical protein
MKEVLQAVRTMMSEFEIPYEFQTWTGEHVYPYWVSEYYGDNAVDESGFSEHAPILSGFSQEASYGDLLDNVERIRSDLLFGRGGVFGDVRVVIFAQDIRAIPQQDNLKRIDVTLKVLAWKGVRP